jgi:hypothetical protein
MKAYRDIQIIITQIINNDVLTPKLFNEKNVSNLALPFSGIHEVGYTKKND